MRWVATRKAGVGPFPDEIYHLTYPSPSNGVTVADTLKALDHLFAASTEPARIAAARDRAVAWTIIWDYELVVAQIAL